MTLEPSELLGRLAATLRGEIGPAVGDEYTRTQAFMASVIAGKLAKQLELASSHAEAENADVSDLHEALGPVLADAPAEVARALADARSDGTIAGLGGLVDELYRWGVDRPQAGRALGLIRPVLRRDIDRRMEVAR